MAYSCRTKVAILQGDILDNCKIWLGTLSKGVYAEKLWWSMYCSDGVLYTSGSASNSVHGRIQKRILFELLGS
jgi:hypothetical protein